MFVNSCVCGFMGWFGCFGLFAVVFCGGVWCLACVLNV